MTVRELIRLALMEIRVTRAGNDPSAEDTADALLILNQYLDLLNGTPRALYSTTETTFTMTASLQPHTIGLTANSPTFSVSINRPTRILNANVVLANNIRVPVDIITNQEWDEIAAGAAAGETVTITSSIPRYLNYRPAWPNGSIFLWPVPTANKLELRFQTLLASLALADTFTLPMGYEMALRLTLAEFLAPAFGQAVSRETAMHALEARAEVWGSDDVILSVIPDAGVPMGTRGGGYNFRTGQVGGRF